jgi:hypothetical protein
MTDSPAFAPVPVTPRRNGWTPERQRAFIDALAQWGEVVTAAAAVGMSPKSAYALRRRPGAVQFAAAWDEAVRGIQGDLARIAFDHAVNGTIEPVFRGRRQIGVRRVRHDRLLMAALRSLHPRFQDL